MEQYLIAIVTFTAIYGLIGLGLNLQWGLTGLVNLGQVAFFAVGAYASALLLLNGANLVVALAAAAILPATLATLVALITPRLREDYLAIVTLGLAEVIRLIFLNEKWIAGGPDGLTGIPRPLLGSSSPSDSAWLFMMATLAALLLFFLINWRIATFPIGRVLKAIRTDEVLAASLGKNVLRFKTQMLAVGASMAGIAGAFYASYLTFISPAMFTAQVSLNVLVAVLIGGQGNAIGVLIGTAIVTCILEGTRFIKDYVDFLGGVELAALRMIIIGLALIVIVLVRYRKAAIS
jgi:branched-chain amino acid transport system permease protein